MMEVFRRISEYLGERQRYQEDVGCSMRHSEEALVTRVLNLSQLGGHSCFQQVWRSLKVKLGLFFGQRAGYEDILIEDIKPSSVEFKLEGRFLVWRCKLSSV